MSGRFPARDGRRQEALRRHRAAALIALAFVVPATATGAEPKPPELELLTESQSQALAQRKVKLAVESPRGDRVLVEAHLTVGGVPSDFHFRLGSKTVDLSGGDARLAFKLNAREREVLAFGEQACEKAVIDATAKVGERRRSISKRLRKSEGC